MDSLQVNGKKYALGLYWSRISTDKVAAEVAALSEEMGMNLGVVRKNIFDGVSKQQVGLTSEKKHSGLISAAAILADLEENALLIEKISPDDYWVCAVADHEVVGGGDTVVDSSAVSELIGEIYAAFGDDVKHIRVCIPELVANELGISGTDSIGFSELLSEHSVENIQKTFNKYTIKSTTGISKAALLFIVFSVLCAGTIYFVLSSTGGSGLSDDEIAMEQQKAEEAKQTELILAKKEPSEKELLEKAYNEEVLWFGDMLSHRDSSSLVKQIYSFVNQAQLIAGGWTATSIQYDASNPTIISISWSNEEIGTPLTLKHSLKGFDSISFGLDGKTAITTYNKISISDKKYQDVIAFISGVKYNYIEMMHDLEIFQYQWALNVGIATERPTPIQGIKDQTLAVTRQLVLKSKKFDIKNSDLYSLLNTTLIFDKAKTAVISKIDIDLKKNFEWSLSGEVYEK